MAKKKTEVVVPPPPATNPVYQPLAWIGIGMEGNRISIHNEGRLEAFNKFVGPTESDIRDMASVFSKRTTAQGHINFWMRRVKNILGIMHWAQ